MPSSPLLPVPGHPPHGRQSAVARPAAAFTAILALFALLLGAGAPAAQAKSVAAITGVTVSPLPGVSVGDAVTLKATWAAPAGTKAGDTFDMSLPAFVTGVSASFALKDDAGDVYGNCVVKTDRITCTFTPLVEKKNDVKGNLNFVAAASQTSTATSWKFPVSGGTTITTTGPIINRPDSSDVPTTTRKWTWSEVNDGVSYLKWGVDIKGADLVGKQPPFTLVDQCQSPLKITLLDGFAVSINGGPVEEVRKHPELGLVITPQSDPSLDKCNFTVTFTKPVTAATNFRIIYSTLAPAGTPTRYFTNKVELAGKNILNAEGLWQAAGGNAEGTDKTGEVTWTKTDEDGAPLGGTSWSLQKSDGTRIEVTDNDALDLDKADGSFRVGGLELRSYTLTELSAPTGYDTNPGSWNTTLSPDSDATKKHDFGTIVNTRKTGAVRWTKVDASANLLAGSEWSLTGPGDGTRTIVDNGEEDTDSDAGAFRIADLAWGDYTLTETKAPEGFALDPTPRTFSVGATELSIALGDIVNVAAAPELGSLSWTKTNEGDAPLAGSTWSLTGPGEYSKSITDNGEEDLDAADGAFKIAELPLGEYTLTETVAPTGYELDSTPRTVTVTGGETTTTAGPFKNLPIPGSVTWTKTDADGKALSGSEWTLSSAAGDVAVIDNGENDADPANGAFKVTGLAWGEYTLTETKAPVGFELSTDSKTVTITATELNLGFGAIINVPESPKSGMLRWNKVDPDGAALLGSEWEVTGPGGDTAVVVDNGENDRDPADGALMITGLIWGEYTIVETKAPEGYVLDATPHTVTLASSAAVLVMDPIVNRKATTPPPVCESTPPPTTPSTTPSTPPTGGTTPPPTCETTPPPTTPTTPCVPTTPPSTTPGNPETPGTPTTGTTPPPTCETTPPPVCESTPPPTTPENPETPGTPTTGMTPPPTCQTTPPVCESTPPATTPGSPESPGTPGTPCAPGTPGNPGNPPLANTGLNGAWLGAAGALAVLAAAALIMGSNRRRAHA